MHIRPDLLYVVADCYDQRQWYSDDNKIRPADDVLDWFSLIRVMTLTNSSSSVSSVDRAIYHPMNFFQHSHYQRTRTKMNPRMLMRKTMNRSLVNLKERSHVHCHSDGEQRSTSVPKRPNESMEAEVVRKVVPVVCSLDEDFHSTSFVEMILNELILAVISEM